MVRTIVLLVCVAGVFTIAASMSCSQQLQQTVVDAEVNNGTRSPVVAVDQVDHSSWNVLLSRYVDKTGMVDYASWKHSEADRTALKLYLASLSAADVTATATEGGKLAYWINAYNALTVHGILEVYPTSSIRNHTAKVFGYNIWDDLLLPVGDRQYSLNQMEHEILRKMNEPRIHFAIVCASMGCPRLRNEAYDSKNLQTQLADNTRDFFAQARNLQTDVASRSVRVSSILDWFGEDFGDSPQRALASVATYMPDKVTKELVSSGDFTISFLEYDWSLNEQ